MNITKSEGKKSYYRKIIGYIIVGVIGYFSHYLLNNQTQGHSKNLILEGTKIEYLSERFKALKNAWDEINQIERHAIDDKYTMFNILDSASINGQMASYSEDFSSFFSIIKKYEFDITNNNRDVLNKCITSFINENSNMNATIIEYQTGIKVATLDLANIVVGHHKRVMKFCNDAIDVFSEELEVAKKEFEKHINQS